jgi:ribosomal protein S26
MNCAHCGAEIPEDQVLEFTGTGAVYGYTTLRAFRKQGITWLVSDSDNEEVKCPSCGELTPVDYTAAQDSLQSQLPEKLTLRDFDDIAAKYKRYEANEAGKAGQMQRKMRGVLYLKIKQDDPPDPDTDPVFAKVDPTIPFAVPQGMGGVDAEYFVVIWKVHESKMELKDGKLQVKQHD